MSCIGSPLSPFPRLMVMKNLCPVKSQSWVTKIHVKHECKRSSGNKRLCGGRLQMFCFPFLFSHQNAYFGYVFQRLCGRLPHHSEEMFENECDTPKPEKNAPGAEIPVMDTPMNASKSTTTSGTANDPSPRRNLGGTTTQLRLIPRAQASCLMKMQLLSPTVNVFTQGELYKAVEPQNDLG